MLKVFPLTPPVDDPYLTLMGFNDPHERDELLGPLFASEAKADTPVFGPHRFTLSSAKSEVESAVRKLLQSPDAQVVNLLAAAGTGAEQASSKQSTLSNNLEQLRLELKASKSAFKKGDSEKSSKVLSSIELHDKSHYTSASLGPSAQLKSDILDQIMLQRAARGYLFDCTQNQAIATDDPWLQDVWRWIKGKFTIFFMSAKIINYILGAEHAAADDGMISGPLDLSYMGVYTIWMNLLGISCPN
jgi:hypothetical protein